MVSKKRVPFARSALFLVPGMSPRFPDQPKIDGPNDDASSRMGDEGCPNESSSDDATEYSREEEERANSMSCEEGL